MLTDNTRAFVALVMNGEVCSSPYFAADLHSLLSSRRPEAVKILQLATSPLFRIAFSIGEELIRVHADEQGLFVAFADGRSGMVQFRGICDTKVPCRVLSDEAAVERMAALSKDWIENWSGKARHASVLDKWADVLSMCETAKSTDGADKQPTLHFMDERIFADAVETVLRFAV